jgi:outer membrane protein OmpA-like peptidoglycan-associated protein
LVPTRAQKITAKRKKAAEEKKVVAKKKETGDKTQKVIETTAVDIDTIKVAQTTPSPPPSEATTTTATVKAGNMKQDPMIIEKVTLHFAFEFNSSDLDDPTEAFLDELALTLKQDENLKLNIEGHTDNVGSDKFNLKLSLKRADVVKSLLIKKGISAERLHTEGKGMREPLNDNLTVEDQAKNRRVEITVFY